MKKLTLLILLFLPSLCKADVYQKVLDRSVVIHMKFVGDDLKWHRGGCSGTFIDDTHILSAAHCFSDSPEMLAWSKDYTGESHLLMVVKIDTLKDLALCTVVGQKHHKYAKRGPEGRLGQQTITVGSPYGLDFLLSTGIISRLRMGLPPFTGTYLIHTGMINPGSSGGGIFDTSGRLIGVNTIFIGSPFGWVGISCAVDAETIKGFLNGR